MLVVKNLLFNAGEVREADLIPGWGRSPGQSTWQPIPIFLSRESRGQRILEGYGPYGHKELDTTSDLVGEGNGTPLQYSCLENPMDGGAWWAPVHGVTKSRTRLSNFTFTLVT